MTIEEIIAKEVKAAVMEAFKERDGNEIPTAVFDGKLALTLAEFAQYMQVSMPVARDIARRDGFPNISTGGKWVIPVAPLTKWLEENCR